MTTGILGRQGENLRDPWSAQFSRFLQIDAAYGFRRSGKLLFDATDVLPRILPQTAEALAEIQNSVLVAALGAGKLVPGYRHRYRRAGAGTGRIDGDRGLLQRIAQIVDEDFAATQGFRDLGNIALGTVGSHGERH